LYSQTLHISILFYPFTSGYVSITVLLFPSYKATTTPKKATNPTIPPTTPVGRAAAPVAGFLAPPVAFAPLAAVPVASVFPPVPEPPDAPLVQRAIWLTEVA